jgi:hypothetical protein
MANSKTFIGADKDEVIRQAEEFIKTLDVVEQGYIWAINENPDGCTVIVQYYGFD